MWVTPYRISWAVVFASVLASCSPRSLQHCVPTSSWMNMQGDRWPLAWVSNISCRSEIWVSWELRPSNSLVDFNNLLPTATCFTLLLKITAYPMRCTLSTLCQRLPALYLSGKRKHVPVSQTACSQVSALVRAAEESLEGHGWRWLSDGGAGKQLVLSRPSMVCQRHLSVPSVLCCKGGNFLPACSGKLQCSAPASVLVWLCVRGFVLAIVCSFSVAGELCSEEG